MVCAHMRDAGHRGRGDFEAVSHVGSHDRVRHAISTLNGLKVG